MVKRLNPKNFVDFKKHEKDITNKVFYYIDRDVKVQNMELNDETYKLDDPTDLDLPGQVTDPEQSIKRALFTSYEWSLLKASFCDGYLFCYIDFITGSDSEAKQLKFRVFKLKKE